MAGGRSFEEIRAHLIATQPRFSAEKIEACLQSYLKRRDKSRGNSLVASREVKKERSTTVQSTEEGRVKGSEAGKDYQIRNAEAETDRKRKENEAFDRAEARWKEAEAEKRREKEASDRAKEERRRKETEQKEQQQKWESEREERKRKKQKEASDQALAERKKEERKAEEERLRQIAVAQADKKRKEKEASDRAKMERAKQEIKAEEERLRQIAEAQADQKRKEKEASDRAKMERAKQEIKAEEKRLRQMAEAQAEKKRTEKEASERDKADRRKKEIEAEEERRRRLAEAEAYMMRKEKEAKAERKKQIIEAEEERRRRDTQAEAEKMRRIQEATESAAHIERKRHDTMREEYVERIPHAKAGPEKRRHQDETVSGEDRLIMATQHKRRKEQHSVDERVRMRIEAEPEKINREEEDSANKERKRRVAELEKTDNAVSTKPSTSTATLLPEREHYTPGEAVMKKVEMKNGNVSTLAGRPKMNPLSAVNSRRSPSVCVLADSGKNPSVCALESSSAPTPYEKKPLSTKEVQKRELKNMLAAFRDWKDHEPRFTRTEKKAVKSSNTKPTSSSETRPEDSLSSENMISSNDLTGNEIIRDQETVQTEESHEIMEQDDLNRESITVTLETSALPPSDSTANDPLKSSSAGSMETETPYKSNFEMKKKYRLKKIKTEDPNTDEMQCDYSIEDAWLAKIFPKERLNEALRWIFFRQKRPSDKTVLSQGSQAEKTETIEPCPFRYSTPHLSVNEYNLTFLHGNGYVQFEFVSEEEQLVLEKPDIVATQTGVDDGEEIQFIESTVNSKSFICRCPHNQEVLSKEEKIEAAIKDARRIIKKHKEFLKTHVECISRRALSTYKTRSGNIPWVENKRYAPRINMDIFDQMDEERLLNDREIIPAEPEFHRPGPIVGGIPRCYRLRDAPKICATCKGRIRVYYKPTGFKPIDYVLTKVINNQKPTKWDLRYWRILKNIRIKKRKREKETERKLRLALKKSKAEIFFSKDDYYDESCDSRLTFMDYHRKCLRRFPELVPRSVKEFFKAFDKKFVLEKFHPKTDGDNEVFLAGLLKILDEIDDPENWSGCDKPWYSVCELETDSESETEKEDSRSPSQCSGIDSEGEDAPNSLAASNDVHYASVSASFKVTPVAQKVDERNEKEKDSDEPKEDPVETVTKSAANQPSERIFGEDELLNDPIDEDHGVMNNEENNGVLDETVDNANDEPTHPVIESFKGVENNSEDDQPRSSTPVHSQDQNVTALAKSSTPDLLRISPSNQEAHNAITERFEEDELLRSVSPSDPISTSNPVCDNLDISLDLEQAGNVDIGVTLESLSPQIGVLLNSSDSVQIEREQLQYTEEDLLGEYGQLEEVQELPGHNTVEPVEPLAKKSKLEESSEAGIKKPVRKNRGRLSKIRNDEIEVEDTTGTANEPTAEVAEEEQSSRKPVVFTEAKIEVERGTSTTTSSEKSGMQAAPEQSDEPNGDVVEEAGTSNTAASSETQKAKNTRKRRIARNAKLAVATSSKICESVEDETGENEAGTSDSVALAEDRRKPTELPDNASELVEANPLETEMEQGTEQAEELVEANPLETEMEQGTEQAEELVGAGMEDAVGEVEDAYEKPVTRKRGRNEDAPFLPTHATRTKRHFLSKNNPAPRTRKGGDNELVASGQPVRLTGVVNKDDVAGLGDGTSENFKKLPRAVQRLLDCDSPEKSRSGSGDVEVKSEPIDDEEWAIPDPIGDNTRVSRKRVRQEKERTILANIKKEMAPDEECQVLMMNVSQVKEEVDDPDFQVLSIGFNKEAVEPEEEAPPFKEIDPKWEEQADHRCLMIKGLWNDANEIFSSDPAKFSKLMLIIANDNQRAGRVFKYSAAVEDRYSEFDSEFIKLLAASSRSLTDEQKLCLNYNNFSSIYRNTASQSVRNHKITPYNLHNVLVAIMEIKKCFREDARSFMSFNANNDAVNATETILLGQFIACSLKMAGLSLVSWATATHVNRRLEMIYYGWKMFLSNGGFLRILLALDRPDVKAISDDFRAFCTKYLEEIETNYKKAIEIVKMSDDAIMEHFQIQAKLSKDEMQEINADIQYGVTDSNTFQCLQCSNNQIGAWFSTFDLKLLHSKLHNINSHPCEKCYEDMNDFKYALHRIALHSSLRTEIN